MKFHLNFFDGDKLTVGEAQVEINQLSKYISKIRKVQLNNLLEEDEASILLPFDSKILTDARDIEIKFSGSLKYIVIIGIGGSHLGTEAVFRAVLGQAQYRNSGSPEAIWLNGFSKSDNVIIEKIKANINHESQIAICVITKSGRTLETLAEADQLISRLSARHRNLRERTILITDSDRIGDFQVYDFAKYYFSIPHKVGGRFSVLSHAGLIPLALLGIPIEDLVSGAQKCILNIFENENASRLLKNYVMRLFSAMASNYKVHNLFLFEKDYSTLGLWYRQLLAESLGKINKQGKKVGLLPLVTIGSADLHSMGQYFFEGPEIIYTSMVNHNWNSAPFDARLTAMAGIEGDVTTGQLQQHIYQGVAAALMKHNMPYAEFTYDGSVASMLGHFMQFQMMGIMLLGNLMDVNAFDQPGVEYYKHEVKKLL